MKRLAYVLLVAGLAVGCAQPLSTREKGALIGAGVGAGAGAIVGNQMGRPGTGALVGAGVGAVTGAVVGDAMQSREQQAAVPPPPALPPAQPSIVWVPAWGVYVVQGHDVVVYNNAYYYFHGGRWWLSKSYTGPWAIVTPAPPAIAQLPPGRLHAHLPRHCPPGQAKKGRC